MEVKGISLPAAVSLLSACVLVLVSSHSARLSDHSTRVWYSTKPEMNYLLSMIEPYYVTSEVACYLLAHTHGYKLYCYKGGEDTQCLLPPVNTLTMAPGGLVGEWTCWTTAGKTSAKLASCIRPNLT